MVSVLDDVDLYLPSTHQAPQGPAGMLPQEPETRIGIGEHERQLDTATGKVSQLATQVVLEPESEFPPDVPRAHPQHARGAAYDDLHERHDLDPAA